MTLCNAGFGTKYWGGGEPKNDVSNIGGVQANMTNSDRGRAGLLIKVKKPYIGGPLSIFFLEKGADPANDSLKNE